MFDIVLSVRGQNVYVQGHGGDVWTDELPLRPSFTLETLEQFADSVQRAARHSKALDPDALAIARGLYDAVFQREISDSLTQSAAPNAEMLTIRLIIADRRLQKIPWEALCKPRTAEEFLAKGTSIQVVRGVTSTPASKPREVRGALRVLVIGPDASPESFTRLAAITGASGAIEWLAPILGKDATWKNISQRLRKDPVLPHALHFIGHGGFDEQQSPALQLAQGEDGEPEWMTAETLAHELKANFAEDLRLLVLESCEGAEPGAFGSAAQVLVRDGAAAVISHLWPIAADAALAASKSFYEALALGQTTRGNVMASLSAARRDLLVNRATGFSLVLHVRSSSPKLFDLIIEKDATMAGSKKTPAKEKPNVLTNKVGRQKPTSSLPPPMGVPVETHTSIVLDRVRQWQPILAHCASGQTHLLFVVHGTPEQAMPLFIKRIKSYLPEECKNPPHRIIEVEGKHDRILARHADEWKRCVISKTQAGSGEFDTVFPRETLRGSPVYLFTEGGGPLHLDAEGVKGLIGLFRGQIDPVVRLLELDNKLKYPLRFIVPVEHAKPGSDPSLDALVAGLSGMRSLLLEPLTEITFPPWEEVWEYVTIEFPRAAVDAAFHAQCKTIYDKVVQNPKRTLQSLGDALHPVLYAWEEVDVRRRR